MTLQRHNELVSWFLSAPNVTPTQRLYMDAAVPLAGALPVLYLNTLANPRPVIQATTREGWRAVSDIASHVHAPQQRGVQYPRAAVDLLLRACVDQPLLQTRLKVATVDDADHVDRAARGKTNPAVMPEASAVLLRRAQQVW